MAFLIFSGPTSITAPEIATALRINCGRTLPNTAPDVIINYGAGTFTVPRGTRRVINHPQYLRNKYSMLEHLNNCRNVTIPPFCKVEQIGREIGRSLNFPIIGRTNMHQAGGGYWLCLSQRTVDWARNHGANYFQQWKDIKTEYRVHVFGNRAIGVYKKVLRENPKDDFCRLIAKEICEEGNYNGVNEQTVKDILKKGVKHCTNPDFNIRSLHRGWRFQRDTNAPNVVTNMAIAAVNHSGLDFAAVDMMLLDNNTAAVIELNTGPGMDVGGEAFNAYIACFRTALTTPAPAARPAAARPTVNRPAPAIPRQVPTETLRIARTTGTNRRRIRRTIVRTT